MTDDVLIALGRALLGGIFVYGGACHYAIRVALAAAIGARGLPWPGLALLLASAFQIVAGLALMLGLFVFWAAAGLIVFTIAASVIMLDFWNKSGAERAACANSFVVNIGLVGGLLIAAVGG